jgi:predicted DNA-binding transcriptional regulator AlpA
MLPADRVLTKREVADKIGLSTATIDRMRSRQEFAAEVALSPRRRGWLESTIDQWMAGRTGQGQQLVPQPRA